MTFKQEVGGINPLASLDVTATNINLNGGAVYTTGAQNYNGSVFFGFDPILDSSEGGGDIRFHGTVDGPEALFVNAGDGEVVFGGSVGGNETLNELGVSASNIRFDDALNLGALGATLTADKTTPAAGNIHFSGPVGLAGRTLTASADGDIVFAGAVGSAGGTGILQASIAADGQGSIYVNAPITNADVALTNDVPFTSQNQAAGFGGIEVNANISAPNSLDIVSKNRIYIGADVSAPAGQINSNGSGQTFVTGTINGMAVTGDGDHGGITSGDFAGTPYTWDSINGVFTLDGALSALALSNALQSLAPETVHLNAAVANLDGFGALDMFSGSGGFHVNAALSNTNSSDFRIGAMGAGGDVHVSAPISNGAGLISIVSESGDVHMDAPVNNNSSGGVRFVAGGTIRLNADVASESGGQEYVGAVVLGGDRFLSGGTGLIDFGGTIDGTHALTVAAGAGSLRFGGSVGATTPLKSLKGTGPGSTIFGGAGITTTRGQSYSGPVIVSGDVALVAAALDFGGTVDDAEDGAHVLTISGPGNLTFAGKVGSEAALKGLNQSGYGLVKLNGGAVTTTGDQTYGGAVKLGADTLLTAGGDVIFGRDVSGGDYSLTVVADGSVTTEKIKAGALSLTSGETLSWNGILRGTGVSLFGQDLVMRDKVTATTSAGVLMLAGNSFNNAANKKISVHDGGRWLIYSLNPANDVKGKLKGSSEFGTSYPAEPSFSGNGFVYSSEF